jgi:hypothetical protein
MKIKEIDHCLNCYIIFGIQHRYLNSTIRKHFISTHKTLVIITNS